MACAESTQNLELDEKTKGAVIAEFAKKEFKPDLFEVVHKVIFQTCDQGSYRRYMTTPSYQKMLADHAQVEANCLREQHRRTRDFPLVPMEELYPQLLEINTKLARSKLPADKKRLGKTYPQAFKGSKLVDWLIESEFARSRAEAIAIGQRLLDSQLIWELADSAEFEDSATRIYSISTKEGLEKTPGAKSQLKTEGEYHAGWVLLKGVYYHRTYLVVSVEKQMLYMYTTLGDKHARQAIPLSNGSVFTMYYSDGREPIEAKGSNSGGSAASGLENVSPALLKDAAAMKKAKEEAEKKKKAAAAAGGPPPAASAGAGVGSGSGGSSPTSAGSGGSAAAAGGAGGVATFVPGGSIPPPPRTGGSTTVGGIASRASKSMQPAEKAEQPLVAILRVDCEQPTKRSYYFRLDVALEDDVSWPNALRSAGCQFRKPAELEPTPSAALERFKSMSKMVKADQKTAAAGSGPTGAGSGGASAAAGSTPIKSVGPPKNMDF